MRKVRELAGVGAGQICHRARTIRKDPLQKANMILLCCVMFIASIHLYLRFNVYVLLTFMFLFVIIEVIYTTCWCGLAGQTTLLRRCQRTEDSALLHLR